MTITSLVPRSDNRSSVVDRYFETCPEWVARAISVMERLCRSAETITVADLWPFLDLPDEPRAMGAVMLYGLRNGWIELYEVNGSRQHIRPSWIKPTFTADRHAITHHGASIPIYRSRLYQPCTPPLPTGQES